VQTRVGHARARTRGWSQVTAAVVSAATVSATLTVPVATFRTSHSSVGPGLARAQPCLEACSDASVMAIQLAYARHPALRTADVCVPVSRGMQ